MNHYQVTPDISLKAHYADAQAQQHPELTSLANTTERRTHNDLITFVNATPKAWFWNKERASQDLPHHSLVMGLIRSVSDQDSHQRLAALALMRPLLGGKAELPDTDWQQPFMNWLERTSEMRTPVSHVDFEDTGLGVDDWTP